MTQLRVPLDTPGPEFGSQYTHNSSSRGSKTLLISVGTHICGLYSHRPMNIHINKNKSRFFLKNIKLGEHIEEERRVLGGYDENIYSRSTKRARFWNPHCGNK